MKNIFLFVIVLFCYNQHSFSQNNTIKLTIIKPLFGKTNLSYEREINKNLSAISDIQFWFLNEKERNPIVETNKGIRISLELRSYINLKIKKTEKFKGFIGLGTFSGKHRMLMVRKRFSYLVMRPGGGTLNVFAPELSSGNVNLISGGMYLHWGFQFPFGDFIKLELGVLTGKAWTNQKKDSLTLFNFEPYILEEDRAIFAKDFSNKINGFFAEPMINLCFRF